ncbi:MAG: protein translocase subunit SecD [Dehalococcoidales bacterium]|nr:protein translocase subunit SecD [Dehalococcoidales bacterium]
MTRRNTVTFIAVLAILIFGLATLLSPMFGRDKMRLGLDLQGGIHLVYLADLTGIAKAQQGEAVDGAISIIEKRINILGVTEPVIQKQGADRIIVELPGISEVERAKRLIGQTALLEFRERKTDSAGKENWVPATAVINGQEKALTSSYFKENTYVTTDEFGKVLLVFEWNSEGSQLSGVITERLINQPLGIYLSGEPLLGDDGRPIAPIVQSKITDRGQIEGLSLNEAQEMSQMLNAGRIPIPLSPIYEQTVSPILGADFVDKAVKAGIIGISMVMLFMILYYRFCGLLASLALVFYGVTVMAIFKLVPVTLTLAGLGGFILSIGMAVDANVLIFERMKEEIWAGRTIGAAVEAGFKRAWAAIWDSNMTTFIVCIILYWLGNTVAESSALKGFGLTLFIGVAVSMFSAVVVTRVLLRIFVNSPVTKNIKLFNIHFGKVK